MVVFTFSVLDEKQPFLGKFSPKSHNCQFMLKFGTVKLVYNDDLGDEVSAVVIDRWPLYRRPAYNGQNC